MRKRGPKPSDSHQAKQVDGKPVPPGDLTSVALEAFNGVVDDLTKQGTLTGTDSRIIAQYAKAFDLYSRLEKQLANEDVSLLASNGRAFINPLVTALSNLSAQLRQFLNDLGLTPRSRGKTDEDTGVDPKWEGF